MSDKPLTLAEIEQQIAQLKILAEEARKKEEEERKLLDLRVDFPISITVADFLFNHNVKQGFISLVAQYDPEKRKDFVEYLNKLGGKFNPYNSSWAIVYSQWQKFVTEFASDPNNNVKPIKYSPNAEKLILEYALGIDYTVELTHMDIKVHYGFNPPGLYNLSSVPGYKHDVNKRDYTFPLPEAASVYAILTKCVDDFQAKVKYTSEALEFLKNDLSKKTELNTIAQLDEYVPYRDLNLNGYKPKMYQTVAIRFAELANDRCIIGDPMGLGKTFDALARHKMNRDANPKFRSFIVCPAHLVINWWREVKQYLGAETKITVYRGTTPTDFDMQRMIMGKDIEISIFSYNTVGKVHEIKGIAKATEQENVFRVDEDKEENLWVNLINLSRFDMGIIDEAHYIGNNDSGRSKGVRAFTAPRIIELTGTPMVNRPGDLWALLNVIDKRKFPSHGHFVGQYTMDGKRPRNIKELQELMRPMMIRRDKSKVTGIAPINRVTKWVELSPKAQKIYNKALQGVYNAIDRAGNDVSKELSNILAKINRLKYIVALDTRDYAAQLANEIYDEAAEEDKYKKVLITSFFQDVSYGIKQRLGNEAEGFIQKSEGGNFTLISQEKRMQLVDSFCNPMVPTPFLVTTLMSTQEGLNITAAGSTITNDLWWNPKAHDQFEGRAYGRASDSHNITSYYIIAQNTIMEYILELIFDKEMLIREVVDGVESGRASESVAMKLIDRLKQDMLKLK